MAVDPITAQLTQSAVKKAGKPEGLSPQGTNYSTDRSAFGQVLDNQMEVSKTSTSKLLEMADGLMGSGPGQDIKAIPAGEINVDLAKVGETPTTPGSNRDGILAIFQEVNGSQNNFDQLLSQMTSGKKFSTNELMRLQIFAHQHTVTYELVSKFGEMSNRAIQTPIQMQV